MSRNHFQGIWLLAGVLPVLSMAAAVGMNVDPAAWQTISSPLLRAFAGDAWLCCAGAVTIAAPLAGVHAALSRESSGGTKNAALEALSATRPLLVAVLLLTIVSALLTMLVLGPGAAPVIAKSHATMAAVALALATFGAFCGAAFADPLDAAACSVALVLLVAGGLLVSGAWVEFAPQWFIELALMASPLVAVTSAGGVDLVRMDALYRISPLAHVQIDYPAWYAACGWYLSLTLLGFLGLTWKCRAGQSAAACQEDTA
jgi:hypothetical protein